MSILLHDIHLTFEHGSTYGAPVIDESYVDQTVWHVSLIHPTWGRCVKAVFDGREVPFTVTNPRLVPVPVLVTA